MDSDDPRRTKLEEEMDFYNHERTRVEARDERERKYPVLRFIRRFIQIGHPFWYTLIFLLAVVLLRYILLG